MSEIIDVLTLLPAHSPSFTVNTAVLSVDLKIPIHVPAYDYHLVSGGGKKRFTAGDNFTVLSAGYVLPESFGMAKAPVNTHQAAPALAIGIQAYTGGSIYFLPNFQVDGVQLPLENYEIPLNIFVDVMNISDGVGGYPFRTTKFNLPTYLLGLDAQNNLYPQVSMVGVPAILNGTVQNAILFVKILHNYALI
jgi:hypothetical protein